MARYTEDRLAETLKVLMAEKPLNEITVQELVDRANVNRKTFYYHYHSISDLINWMYCSRLTDIINEADITPDSWMTLYSSVMKKARKESPYLAAIYTSNYGPIFRIAIAKCFDRIMTKFVRSSMRIYEQENNCQLQITKRQIGYITHYYSMAFYGMMEEWFLKGMRDSEEYFAHTMKQISHDNMFRTFRMMHDENTEQ